MAKKPTYLFIATLLVASVLSPFASELPDGLDRVAEDHGFADKGRAVWDRSWLMDYKVSFIGSDEWSAAAGVFGVFAVGTVLTLLACLRSEKPRGNRDGGAS